MAGHRAEFSGLWSTVISRLWWMKHDRCREVAVPCDWDGMSYCVDGCGRPATHERLSGMLDEAVVIEIVCCQHARTTEKQEARRG